MSSEESVGGPPQSLSTDDELSSWRQYQANRVGYYDLLALVNNEKISVPEVDITNDQFLEKKLFKTEEIIVNLRERWKAGIPYTSIGTQSLVAVNLNDQVERRNERLKELKKQSKESKEAKNDSSWNDDEEFLLLSPAESKMLVNDARANHVVQEYNQAHVFSLATRCYWHMLRDGESQVIAVTGESGSGKTTMNKMIIRQLIQLSENYARKINRFFMTKKTESPNDESRIPERLKSALILFESLTHAATPLNSNSSRAHKYVEMQFSRHGKLVGAKVVDFLLERNRVARGFEFGAGERNFHIFYDMLEAGAFTREEKERYCLLDGSRHYKYLQVNGGSNGAARLPVSLKRALRGCGFSVRKQDEIFKLISAIMLLGNLEFGQHNVNKDEGSFVKNTDVLEKVASLLGISPEALATTLTQRTTSTGGTICADFLTQAQSRAARDDLATTLYTLLFDFIVAKINSRLDSNINEYEKSHKWEYWIGIFDVGGIENYGLIAGEGNDRNRFWQFATNFADEKIQQWIRQQLFQQKQEDQNAVLARLEEGMFANLSSRIATYSHPELGILTALDAETLNTPLNSINAGSGEKLVEILNRNNPSSTKRQTIFGRPSNSDGGLTHFVPGQSRHSFGVRHYGGTGYGSSGSTNIAGFKVFYDANDFLISNKLGGRGKGSQAFPADYVRMIKGTADFSGSRNQFLTHLIDKQLKVVTHPRESNTIISAVRRGDEATDEGKMQRHPSSRRNHEDTSLSAIVKAKQNYLKKAIINSSKEGEKPDDGTEELSPETALKRQAVATPTTSSEFFSDLTTILEELDNNGYNRTWTVFCIKPNDEFSPKKFAEERVKDQVRRFDLILMMLHNCKDFSCSMSWRSFWSRYKVLEEEETESGAHVAASLKKTTGGGHRHKPSLASVKLEGSELEQLRNQCRQIYEMFAIISQCGNGVVDSQENHIAMNERAWWALERNLVHIENRVRYQKKLEIDRLGLAVPNSTDINDFCYRSVDTDDSKISDDDLDKDFKREMDEQLQEKRKKELKKLKAERTSQRKWWMRITTFLTWWIPTWAIINIGGMNRAEIIQAWREKVALNVIVFFISAIMLFIIVGYGELLCPKTDVFTAEDLKLYYNQIGSGKLYYSMYGTVYDFSSFVQAHGELAGDSRENANKAMSEYAGQDVSKFFKRSPSEKCQAIGVTATGSLVKRAAIPQLNNNNNNDNLNAPSEEEPSGPAPSPNTPTGSVGSADGEYIHSRSYEWFVQRTKTREVNAWEVGKFAFAEQDIAAYDGNGPLKTMYIIIDDNIYNVTDRTGFSVAVRTAMANSAGKEATGNDKSVLTESKVKACLDDRYFIGMIDRRTSPKCMAASYSLLGLTVVLCTVMGAKFLAALQFGARRRPEEQYRYCILQVPCYTEGTESLKKTINSLSLLDYDDSKKLLFIIADGLIKGSGNEKMTPELVLDILGVDNAHEKLTQDSEVPRFDYIALGDGSNRLNRAKVFSGWYRIQARRIPYVVVVKCGKESETRRPGNRGKRDSQLIMMKFLNKVYYQRAMCPLELEIYRQIENLVGVDPSVYEYCLMVDADTEVVGDSLNRLIAVMLHDSLIMGLCGETQIGNELDTWVTMIQVYEYYISHHMAKAFESLFGSVTCLPGCFCMYRIRSPGNKHIPLLIGDDIIRDYEENTVDTLHKKNLLSLGEDRYLTTLMLKYFSEYRTKFTADAACRTIVPEKFDILFSQRRRWINSTIHNLFELLLVNALCGCLFFSMRLVVFLDLFATLTMPASLGYLGYLIFLAVRAGTPKAIELSLYMFAAIYGAQALIFLLRRKWDMIGWMVIYIISLPVFGFFLPLYAFWHFDDFSWGNTRVVTGEKNAGHGGGNEEEQFDEKSIKTMTWDEFKDLPAAKRGMVSRAPSVAQDVQKTNKTAKKEKRRKDDKGDVSDRSDAYTESNVRPLPYFAQGNWEMQSESNAPIGYYQQYLGTAPHRPQSAYPVSQPQTPSLASNPFSDNSALIDGIPASLHPPPDSIPLCLARVVVAEMAAIIQTEDLRTLTKKKVRERVEHNLIQELQHAQKQDYLTQQKRFEDLMKCKQLNLEIDFTLDPERKDWASRCVVEMLKRCVPRK